MLNLSENVVCRDLSLITLLPNLRKLLAKGIDIKNKGSLQRELERKGVTKVKFD
jgi:hypothetical protein